MTEPFVLGDADAARWVVHPPRDPSGDGCVYTVATELHEDGITAATIAKVDGMYDDLATTLSGFVASLANDWQGWDGVRTWQSLERELTIDARHDGRGHVQLGVTLQAPAPDWDDTAWSARSVFVLEAGEGMVRPAADLMAQVLDVGYTLEAVLGASDAVAAGAARYPDAVVVPLRDDVSLVPMTDELFDAVTDRTSVRPFGFWKLPGGFDRMLASWSTVGPVGYVEAGLFGGVGSQRAVLWLPELPR